MTQKIHTVMHSTSGLPLSMRRVTRTIGKRMIVDSLDLEVATGEIVALLGPNGAGKSTTIQMALGFVTPDTGDIRVAGRQISETSARTAIGYIPENIQLYDVLSAMENLEYFSALAGLQPDAEAMKATLQEVGLPENAWGRRVGEFSKGMRQKTGIAIAMLRRCSLLLLDEPTSGLDPAAADDFQHLLSRSAKQGTGILMAAHDIARAHEIADRILVFVEGKIAAQFFRAEISLLDLEVQYRQLAREARA